MPTGPVQVKSVTSCAHYLGDRVGLGRVRGVQLDPLGEQLAGAHVYRRAP